MNSSYSTQRKGPKLCALIIQQLVGIICDRSLWIGMTAEYVATSTWYSDYHLQLCNNFLCYLCGSMLWKWLASFLKNKNCGYIILSCQQSTVNYAQDPPYGSFSKTKKKKQKQKQKKKNKNKTKKKDPTYAR